MKALLPFLLFTTSLLSGQERYFVDEPTLTPDGSEIIFSYHQDLWRVPAGGGTAMRLTALEGNETLPAISPDGRYLAFTSNQYGNEDVYVMPLGGGPITQLTFHEADDRVASWSWDSNTIYFTSGRYNRMSTYTVAAEGGTPVRHFGENYFNNVHNAVEHPDGRVFFNESWESSLFVHRKRYRGPFNPDIKSYRASDDTYTRHTEWEGKDMLPVIDRAGTVYFLSDRDNDEYNLYVLEEGQARRLFTSTTSLFAPAVSADGSLITYVKDYQLYTFDPQSGTEFRVPVIVNDYGELEKSQDFSTSGKVTAFDVAPDGKKLAFVSRGELFVSDMDGKFIREIETGSGRVGEVHWLKDSKTVLFNQTTANGFQNWFSVAGDGSRAARQHTDEQHNNRNLVISHDTSRAVYLSGRNELRIMDLGDFSSKTILEDEFWDIQNTLPRWSPDDAYIAANVRRDFEMDIFIYDVAAGDGYNLTETGVSEWGPYWSPDGDYLYFSSSIHQPSYPRGGGDQNVYRLPLRRFAEPFRGERFARLFASDTTAADSVTFIDRERIMERLEQIGVSFGDQSGVAVIQDGEKQIVLYGGNQEGGDQQLFKTVLQPFEEPKTESIEGKGLGGAEDLVTVKDKHYLLGGGKVLKLDLDKNSTEAVELNYTFRRVLRSEFTQMYYETWANVEQNFYDEEFHQVDFVALRDHYAQFLPYVTTRGDLRRLTNDLLGELNTSHFGFYSSGEEEETTFGARTLDLGINWRSEAPYVVESIIEEGPADYYGIDLRPGDRLTAIDGQQVDPQRNREFYLSRPSVTGEVVATFDRGGSNVTVRLHPGSYNQVNTARYDGWIRDNQRRVDEATQRQVAYVYMKNMGGGALDDFLTEMVSEGHHRDGLILDLRYNTGGNVHDAVLQFLSQRPYLQWRYRGGELALQPNFAPDAKPIVLLINEQSLSDAEMTAEGFKTLGLGTAVGMPTYRWIIFTSGGGLVDGSSYRLPSWGCYTLEGRNLEKTGVEPDIRVDNTMLDRLHARDPQLERAIQVVTQARK